MITSKSAAQKINTLLPLVTIIIGLILLTYMITVESEPGAIPLFLTLAGSIWYYFARRRNNKQKETE